MERCRAGRGIQSRRQACCRGHGDHRRRDQGGLTCHDAATGQTLWQVEEPDVNILSLAYSPDGKTIASGCGGFNNYNGIGYVRLRDAATGKEIGQVPGGPGGVTCVAFSPDGHQLALANRGLVDVWDVPGHTRRSSSSAAISSSSTP